MRPRLKRFGPRPDEVEVIWYCRQAGRNKAHRRDERGAVLVEFALVLPVLLAFLLGTVTVGGAYNQNISMNNAARESSRYGAVRPVEADLAAWLETVADVAVASATGDLDANVAGQYICVAYVYPDGTSSEDSTIRLIEQAGSRLIQTGQTCFVDGRPSDERRVQVQLARDTDIEAVLFSQTITLNANSVTRFERTGG